MNAASISNSARLQRVYSVLRKGKELSTRDIIERAKVCAVNSCIAELKAPINGCDIVCTRRGDKWFYRMEAA